MMGGSDRADSIVPRTRVSVGYEVVTSESENVGAMCFWECMDQRLVING